MPPTGPAGPRGSVLITWLGALSLGIVVGYLTWYFVTHLDSYTIAGLVALITVLVGATVVAFLGQALGVNRAVGFGLYAIGLLVGSIAFVAAYVVVHGAPPAIRVSPNPSTSVQTPSPTPPTPSPTPTPSARILAPIQGQVFSSVSIPATGDIQYVPAGMTAWLVVKAQVQGSVYYWPETALPANGNWSATAYVGNSQSNGQWTLMIVQADSVADAIFRATVAAYPSDQNRGLAQADYPSSDAVTLVTRDVIRQPSS